MKHTCQSYWRIGAVMALAFSGTSPAIEFGNIDVVQNNNTNNNQDSDEPAVTTTVLDGSTEQFVVSGDNKGDFEMQFSSDRAYDVVNGVMLSAVTQNGRNNAAGGGEDGISYGTPAAAYSSAGYYIAVHAAAGGAESSGSEFNVNLAGVYFRLDEDYLVGHARNDSNGADLTTLVGSPTIELGTHFVDHGSGISQVDLTALSSFGVAATAANGVLLVNGGKNEDNFAMSQDLEDGTFVISNMDNGQGNAQSYEQDPVCFAFIPTAIAGDNVVTAVGRVQSDGTTEVAGGNFTVTRIGTGEWLLQIPGQDQTTGTLIVSADGGIDLNEEDESVPNQTNNFVSYEWDEVRSGWVVQSRNLDDAVLEDGLTGDEDMFSFAFFTVNPANAQPTVAFSSPTEGQKVTVGGSLTVTASAADTDGVVTGVEFLLDGESVGVDTSAPYEVVLGPFDSLRNGALSAVVSDDGGAEVLSGTVNFEVVPETGAGGMYFNGLNEYVTFGDEGSFKLGAFTLETWFKREGDGISTSSGSGGVTVVPLIAKGRGEDDQSNLDCNYIFGIDAETGVLAADFEDSLLGKNVPVYGVTPVTTGEWQHAAATFDGSEWKLYLNGNLEATLDAGDLVPRADSIQHASLASALNSEGVAAGFFQGYLDEARIWNYARSQEEIRQTGSFEVTAAAGLVGRWGMTEGSGATITSSAAGSVVGDVVNETTWTEGATFTNNIPPSVTWESPDAGMLDFNSVVALVASASDADGTVVQVEFFDNGVSVGSDTTAPYSVDVMLDTLGDHHMTAVATDNTGAISMTSAVLLTAVLAESPDMTGYTVGVIDGGFEDVETSGYTVPLDDEFSWLIEASTSGPLAFENHAAGAVTDDVGDFYPSVDGAPLDFASGVVLATNHGTLENLAPIDNIVSVYPTDDGTGGYLFGVGVQDNEAPGASDPVIREESSRFSLGYFPYADGWYGAYVDWDGANANVLHGSSNFPAGVSVEITNVSEGYFEIDGLPTAGNLLAVSEQDGADHIPSVGLVDGRWRVATRDNTDDLESEDFGFLYVPYRAGQVLSGLVGSDGTMTALNGELEMLGATVTIGTQGYQITFGDGSIINPSNSVMFVSPDFNNGNGGDNIYTYFGLGDSFVVFSHDLPNLSGNYQSGGFRFLVAPLDPVELSGDEVFVVASDASATEGGDTGAFTFTRTGDTTGALTVYYSVTGSATAGTDYTALTGEVTIAAGQRSASVLVDALDDEFLELRETVSVSLVAGAGYTVGTYSAANVWIISSVSTVETTTVTFQEGVNGYTGQWGKRVGEDGTDELGSSVSDYYLDGRPGSSSPDQNGLIRFDNIFGDGDGRIPYGAGIQDAKLIITTSTAGSANSGGPFLVDQLLYPVDDETTYEDLQFGEAGDETSGDPTDGFDGTEGARSSSTGYPIAGFGAVSQGDVSTANVTAILQAWSQYGYENHGFAIYTGGTTDGWSYNTVGNENPLLRPKLEVTYTLEPTRTYYYQADAQLFTNNGGGTGDGVSQDGASIDTLFMDWNDGTSGTTETIIRFPVTFGDPGDLNTIPDGETIVKAELMVRTNSPVYGGSTSAQTGGPYTVHQMLVDWDSTSTFGLTGPIVPADIDESVVEVVGMGWDSTTFSEMTSIVQNWRAGDANYGINLKPATTDGWQTFALGIQQTAGLADAVPWLRVTTAILDPTAFDDYMEAMGASGENLADDDDMDGIIAVMEYALGLDPRSFDVLPGLVADGEGGYTISFEKGIEAASDERVNYSIEISSDLSHWTEAELIEDSASRISAAVPGDMERVFCRLAIDYQQ
ncbi:MAG: Ig-like domain-containing protein [Verrucomicrobiota bacterium JB025]|nr:LamG-like jellyroll fold domain-containing protein [Verrucomicrobiota bacterium JB025]